MTISMDKKYRTRDGREVRILAVDGFGKHPVHGVYLSEVGWVLYRWAANGSAYPPWYADGNTKDLIEVKPRIQREYWMNLYTDNGWSIHTQEFHAHNVLPIENREKRIACVKITIDCEEGEGL